jgi:hypothetical protein
VCARACVFFLSSMLGGVYGYVLYTRSPGVFDTAHLTKTGVGIWVLLSLLTRQTHRHQAPGARRQAPSSEPHRVLEGAIVRAPSRARGRHRQSPIACSRAPSSEPHRMLEGAIVRAPSRARGRHRQSPIACSRAATLSRIGLGLPTPTSPSTLSSRVASRAGRGPTCTPPSTYTSRLPSRVGTGTGPAAAAVAATEGAAAGA